MTKGKKVEEELILEEKSNKKESKAEKSAELFVAENNSTNDNLASGEVELQETVQETVQELDISKEYAEEKVKQALESQSPKRKRRSTIINLCLLLVNIVFMFFIVKGLISNLGDENISTVISQQGKKLWWLVGGLCMYVVYMLVQVLMYFVLIKDITGKKRMGLAYDVAVIGKYYDNITPFAVGGQPMQIVRLAKSGISAGTSTSIPIIKMMFNSAMNVIVAAIFFIFGVPRITFSTPLNEILFLILIILGVIGLLITAIVVLFTFLIASGNLITRSFISGVLRIGYKLKLVKNYRQSFQKILNQVTEYKVSFKFMWKNKKTLFKVLALSLFECMSYAMIPYFVVQAFVTTIDISPMLFLVICISEYYICTMASSFIPLPGGTGIMEISFIFLFGIVLGNNIVWALLAYRIISYYLLLAHGFLHEVGGMIYSAVKNKKQLKKKESC